MTERKSHALDRDRKGKAERDPRTPGPAAQPSIRLHNGLCRALHPCRSAGALARRAGRSISPFVPIASRPSPGGSSSFGTASAQGSGTRTICRNPPRPAALTSCHFHEGAAFCHGTPKVPTP
ncbi:hypothetical protein [Azospirillum largimobile]